MLFIVRESFLSLLHPFRAGSSDDQSPPAPDSLTFTSESSVEVHTAVPLSEEALHLEQGTHTLVGFQKLWSLLPPACLCGLFT